MWEERLGKKTIPKVLYGLFKKETGRTRHGRTHIRWKMYGPHGKCGGNTFYVG